MNSTDLLAALNSLGGVFASITPSKRVYHLIPLGPHQHSSGVIDLALRIMTDCASSCGFTLGSEILGLGALNNAFDHFLRMELSRRWNYDDNAMAVGPGIGFILPAINDPDIFLELQRRGAIIVLHNARPVAKPVSCVVSHNDRFIFEPDQAGEQNYRQESLERASRAALRHMVECAENHGVVLNLLRLRWCHNTNVPGRLVLCGSIGTAHGSQWIIDGVSDPLYEWAASMSLNDRDRYDPFNAEDRVKARTMIVPQDVLDASWTFNINLFERMTKMTLEQYQRQVMRIGG